jgi:hypothetical protein
VCSPEFEFEKDLENVRWAARDLEIGYPIAVDSDHKIWHAFNNRHWPALYFEDEGARRGVPGWWIFTRTVVGNKFGNNDPT